VDVYVPDGADGRPAVVLLHGYTEPYASSELYPLAPLAEEIALMDAVVFFFKWDTRDQFSSRSADDLGCIGSFVQAHAADYGARSDRVVVIGHSMGAEVGVNLAFRSFDIPQDSACVETGSGPTVEAFLGISGDYSSLGIPVDADRKAFRYPSGCFYRPYELEAADLFEPGLRVQQAFELGGYSSMDLAPEDLRVVLLAGTEDLVFCPIPDINQDYADALQASGVEVELVEVAGAGHSDIIEPDTAPGQNTLKIIESILADLQEP
jgi:pimeloyl-ACP methyl ester carboxylesterase